MDKLPLWALLGIYVLSAVAVWLAGIQISKATDKIDDRYGLGDALGGIIILAIVTDLPEIAIAISAAATGQYDIILGNLLGGIAIQTLVVAVLDPFEKEEPLSRRVGSLLIALEGVVTIAVVTVSILGIQLPRVISIGGLSPANILIVITWLGGIWMISHARKGLTWKLAAGDADAGQDDDGEQQAGGEGDKADSNDKAATKNDGAEGNDDKDAAGSAEKQVGGSKEGEDKSDKKAQPSMMRTWIMMIVASLVTLGAGVLLELSGNAAADQLGINGVVFGATFLAAVTALPELSTGFEAVKLGDYRLVMSDVIGSNAFLMVLFFPASLVAGHPILAEGTRPDIYLSALGILVTVIYVGGVIVRPKKQILRMGIDSLLVIIIYILGIIGLLFLPQQLAVLT